MYRLWTDELIELRCRLRLPRMDAMDRATWLLAGAGLLGMFVEWG